MPFTSYLSSLLALTTFKYYAYAAWYKIFEQQTFHNCIALLAFMENILQV